LKKIANLPKSANRPINTKKIIIRNKRNPTKDTNLPKFIDRKETNLTKVIIDYQNPWKIKKNVNLSKSATQTNFHSKSKKLT